MNALQRRAPRPPSGVVLPAHRDAPGPLPDGNRGHHLLAGRVDHRDTLRHAIGYVELLAVTRDAEAPRAGAYRDEGGDLQCRDVDDRHGVRSAIGGVGPLAARVEADPLGLGTRAVR